MNNGRSTSYTVSRDTILYLFSSVLNRPRARTCTRQLTVTRPADENLYRHRSRTNCKANDVAARWCDDSVSAEG